MNESAITVRYAKAYFSFAKEKNILDILKTDMELVLELCSSAADFLLLLESPVVKISKKTALFRSIFENQVNEISLNFLMLVIRNKRESYIPGICRNFLELCRKDQNIKTALLTTAVEISKTSTNKIQDLLSKKLEANIELSTRVNPDIIGGLVLRMEDTQYDASVATQLKKIEQSLLKAEL